MTVRCPSNGHSASSTSGLVALATQTSTGRAACSCFPWPAVMPRRPHCPLLLPPLARPSLYSPIPPVILRQRQPHTTAEPVNPPTPLGVGIHYRVFPFLGLAVVHRPGALTAAWSMWSRNDFHRKSTVHGEADSWVQEAARKCLLITRKIIIPPPDNGDPPDGPLYFVKKVSP